MIPNPFKTQRIDYLFFGSFAGLIILLLVLISWITYSLTVKELVNNTSIYQQRLLNELTKQVVLQMKSVEQMSLAISRNADLLNFLSLKGDFYARQKAQNEIESYLANETYSNTIIHSIELYMKTPALPLTRRGAVSIGKISNIQDKEWFPMINNSDFSWIGERTVDTDYEGKQPVISFARKIYDNSGIYRGLLVLNVKASSVKEIVRGEETEPSRILLDSGKRIISSVGDPLIKNNLASYIKQIDGGEMYVHIPSDHRLTESKDEAILVFSNVLGANWHIVELTPWNQITQGSVRIAMILIILGTSFILISLYFTLILSKQFVRPIRLLLRAMSGSPMETKEVNLPSDYKNEFGALFKGYRKFIERIRELYDSLEDKYLRQREYEIQALQAMINPHFLYNTLDQINWMAIEAGQSKISRVLELMGRMFRIGLSNGKTVITIHEELEHIRCYLEIQQIRWEEGLSVDIDVPETMAEYYIPKLTLQPFVENAIMHGFNERETGHIHIAGREVHGGLLLVIKDNGIGISPDWRAKKQRKTGGYGIKNVMDRLDAYFGVPYGIEIVGIPEQGTTVTVYVPKLETHTIGG